jgi:hypothetical protein
MSCRSWESPPCRVPEQQADSLDVSGVAPRVHGNGQQNCAGRTRRCQYSASTLTMSVSGGIILAGRRSAERCKGPDGMDDPIRPPRHPICRSTRQAWRRALGCALALEPGGRIILARAAAKGVSPMRPAHAKPNVVLVAWPDGVQDSRCTRQQASLSSARLGSKQTGPSSRKLQQAAPASHTPGLVPASPDSLQVRAAGPPRQAFPCSFYPSI